MATKQGVLWDLDGVLVDTGDFHYEAWSRTLAEYDIPFTRESFRATFGMNNLGVLSVLIGRTPSAGFVAEVSDRKEQLFRHAIQGQVDPLPGVHLWVTRLDKAGVEQAIASSAPEANIDVLVEELGLRSCFEAMVSGFDMPGKPDPAVFLKAARLMDVPAERCVVVEDATAGVGAARRAGMKCIAVTTTHSASVLSEADIVVDRLDALPSDAFARLLGRTGDSE